MVSLKRHRVILLGVREDMWGVRPELLKQRSQVGAEAVLNGLPELRSGLSREEATVESFRGIRFQNELRMPSA